MIGGDQHHRAGPPHRFFQTAKTMIDRGHRAHCGVQISAMPDHVGVGVIDHDKVELAARDGRDKPVGDLRRRHFRL